MQDKATPHTQKLLTIVSELRKKCPWDRKQTHRTLVPYLLEEAYETLEAIRSDDSQALREELGDLLLQVVLHAEIASESGAFDFEAVAQTIGDKMVRRHPHVYSDEKALAGKKHHERWTELKKKEKPKRSLLDGTPRSMPALQLCQRYGEIASSVSFDWKDVRGVWAKLGEEIAELEKEVRSKKKNRKRLQEELGDVLFTVANLARHLGLNAELAGRDAAAKFQKRFATMEKLAAGRKLSTLSAKEWDTLWRQAK